MTEPRLTNKVLLAAARTIREVAEDLAPEGHTFAGCRTFADLHDECDANDFLLWLGEGDRDDDLPIGSDEWLAEANAMTDIVDEWLRDRDPPAEPSDEWPCPECDGPCVPAYNESRPEPVCPECDG